MHGIFPGPAYGISRAAAILAFSDAADRLRTSASTWGCVASSPTTSAEFSGAHTCRPTRGNPKRNATVHQVRRACSTLVVNFGPFFLQLIRFLLPPRLGSVLTSPSSCWLIHSHAKRITGSSSIGEPTNFRRPIMLGNTSTRTGNHC